MFARIRGMNATKSQRCSGFQPHCFRPVTARGQFRFSCRLSKVTGSKRRGRRALDTATERAQPIVGRDAGSRVSPRLDPPRLSLPLLAPALPSAGTM